MSLFRSLAAIWNVLILLLVIGGLGWFFFWFGLRRIIRARRIAAARDRRLLREAAERHN